jgi:hypothetical protein
MPMEARDVPTLARRAGDRRGEGTGASLDADVVAREGDADTMAVIRMTGGDFVSSDAIGDGPTMLGSSWGAMLLSGRSAGRRDAEAGDPRRDSGTPKKDAVERAVVAVAT